MIQIRFCEAMFESLRRHLIRSPHDDEEGALLLAQEVRSGDDVILLVSKVIPVPDASFVHKGRSGLTIDPEFLAPVIKQARNEDASVILTHSHPFSDESVWFSSIDDAGERSLMPKIRDRVPGRTHGALVFGQRAVAGRVRLPDAEGSVEVDRISEVGSRIHWHSRGRGREAGKAGEAAASDRFARQVLAFSEAGQALIRWMRVGIVGLGGIGSQVFQNLVHLGVRHFVLVDHDIVTASNLSRLVGATAEDALLERPKVEVMRDLGRRVDPAVEVRAIAGNVYDAAVAGELRTVDVVFGCTDTMISRMVLTRFPKQYFVPFIDVGVNIQVGSGQVERIGGRVMVLTPESPCLDCMEYLNHDVLTHELSAFGAVGPTPYVTGLDEPVASVISYNTTLAGLAVSEFIKMVVPGFEDAEDAEDTTFQVLDGIAGTVRRVALEASRRCGVCDDLFGRGDSLALPTVVASRDLAVR